MPEREGQETCGEIECAIADGKVKAAKEIRKNIAKHRASEIPRLKEKAQIAFNKYIRVRDGELCISCGFVPHVKNGELVTRQFHAGHYKSQGGNGALRYDENNVHAQCSICNNHLSGNLANYRIALIKKIGEDEVVKLEKSKEIKKWDKESLDEIITIYKAKLKALS